jgi:hypothetical protein
VVLVLLVKASLEVQALEVVRKLVLQVVAVVQVKPVPLA